METPRQASLVRKTGETGISMDLTVDGSGVFEGSCGIPFMDHMFHLFCRHGQFDLKLEATGDLEVDYHHLVEDMGIVLGSVFRQALGEKRGIQRYGFFLLPMDETLVRVVLDLSGRAYLVYRVACEVRFVRDFNIYLLREFFQGFANALGANLHILLEYGDEPHHIAEAQFKGLARALDMATRIDARIESLIPSTKGSLSDTTT